MERRLHERVTVRFEAKVTELNNLKLSACGMVSDISEAGICVAIPLQLAPGDLVQLEMADSVLRGHVVYSRSESSLFRTGIEVERVRLGATEISQLLQRTLSEAMPGAPGLDRSETYIG